MIIQKKRTISSIVNNVGIISVRNNMTLIASTNTSFVTGMITSNFNNDVNKFISYFDYRNSMNQKKIIF